jgi:hypothetical protein
VGKNKTQSERENEAWDKIMEIAREHSMVQEAFGGVAILVHPDEQRQKGIRAALLHKSHRWTMGECVAAAKRGE